MAVFHPETRAALFAALLSFAVSAGAAAPPRLPSREATQTQPIIVDAGSSQIDSRANRLTFFDVKITQGQVSIQAEKAVASGTGPSFNDSRWEFTGTVRIHVEGGSLQGTAASVRFAGNRIAEAQTTGTPAEFEQQLVGAPRPVRGHAERIDYDFDAQTVRLTGDAWMFDGRNEMTTPVIVYSINNRLIENVAAPGSRVFITIRPEGAPDAPAPAPVSGRPESRQ